MKPLPHNYEVALTGAAVGYATASGCGLPDLTTAPPAEYDGPGDAWSPEHLLLAAISVALLILMPAPTMELASAAASLLAVTIRDPSALNFADQTTAV